MAELAKARSMQSYIILYKTTLQLGVRKLPKVFYTAATWRGIEPRIYDTLVRRSTSKPPRLEPPPRSIQDYLNLVLILAVYVVYVYYQMAFHAACKITAT